MIPNELFKRFPTDAQNVVALNIQISVQKLAADIDRLLVQGREKSLALTHLEEVHMWLAKCDIGFYA